MISDKNPYSRESKSNGRRSSILKRQDSCFISEGTDGNSECPRTPRRVSFASTATIRYLHISSGDESCVSSGNSSDTSSASSGSSQSTDRDSVFTEPITPLQNSSHGQSAVDQPSVFGKTVCNSTTDMEMEPSNCATSMETEEKTIFYTSMNMSLSDICEPSLWQGGSDETSGESVPVRQQEEHNHTILYTDTDQYGCCMDLTSNISQLSESLLLESNAHLYNGDLFSPDEPQNKPGLRRRPSFAEEGKRESRDDQAFVRMYTNSTKENVPDCTIIFGNKGGEEMEFTQHEILPVRQYPNKTSFVEEGKSESIDDQAFLRMYTNSAKENVPDCTIIFGNKGGEEMEFTQHEILPVRPYPDKTLSTGITLKPKPKRLDDLFQLVRKKELNCVTACSTEGNLSQGVENMEFTCNISQVFPRTALSDITTFKVLPSIKQSVPPPVLVSQVPPQILFNPPLPPVLVSKTVPLIVNQAQMPIVCQTVSSVVNQAQTSIVCQTVPSPVNQAQAPIVCQTVSSVVNQAQISIVCQTVPSAVNQFQTPVVCQTMPSSVNQTQTPVVCQILSSVVNQSQAPIVCQTLSSVVNQAQTPIVCQTVPSIVNQAETPIVCQTIPLAVNQIQTPIVCQTMSSAVNQTQTPIVCQTMPPIINQMLPNFVTQALLPVQVVDQTVPQIAIETVSLISNQIVPPIVNQTLESVVRHTVPPIDSEVQPKLISQALPPAVDQTIPPFASQTGPPFVSQTVPPFASQTGPPFASQTGPPFGSQTGPPFASQTGTSYISQTGPPFVNQTGPPFVNQTGPTIASQTVPLVNNLTLSPLVKQELLPVDKAESSFFDQAESSIVDHTESPMVTEAILPILVNHAYIPEGSFLLDLESVNKSEQMLSESVNLQDLYEIIGISRLEKSHIKSVPVQKLPAATSKEKLVSKTISMSRLCCLKQHINEIEAAINRSEQESTEKLIQFSDNPPEILAAFQAKERDVSGLRTKAQAVINSCRILAQSMWKRHKIDYHLKYSDTVERECQTLDFHTREMVSCTEKVLDLTDVVDKCLQQVDLILEQKRELTKQQELLKDTEREVQTIKLHCKYMDDRVITCTEESKDGAKLLISIEKTQESLEDRLSWMNSFTEWTILNKGPGTYHFGFLYNTLILAVDFDNSSSCPQISRVHLHSRLAVGSKPWAKLAHNLIVLNVNCQRLQDSYADYQHMHQLLADVSAIVCDFRQFSMELKRAHLKHSLNINDNRLTFTVSNRKTRQKITLDTTVAPNYHPHNPLVWTAKTLIGSVSSQDVKSTVDQIVNGPNYMTRVLSQAEKLLAVMKR